HPVPSQAGSIPVSLTGRSDPRAAEEPERSPATQSHGRRDIRAHPVGVPVEELIGLSPSRRFEARGLYRTERLGGAGTPCAPPDVRLGQRAEAGGGRAEGRGELFRRTIENKVNPGSVIGQ